VAIDPSICAGRGQCAASDVSMRRLRALLTAYREADGERAIVLLHEEAHGTPLIEALARFGDGLPANVLPLALNEITQVGLEAIAATFAYGVPALRLLLRGKPRHDMPGLSRTGRRADPHGPRIRAGDASRNRD
jgi:hypothetical protein